MSQVVTCPNCDRKLALRDELKGRALICPKCKGRFMAPADEPQRTADFVDTTSGESPLPGGSDMAFLDDLGPASVPAAARTAAETSARARPAARAHPSAARAAAFSTASSASRTAAKRVKCKNAKMMVYIGGGIAALVLGFVGIMVVMLMPPSSGGAPPNRGGVRKLDENLRFGLTESQRRHFFEDLFHAVDENGPNKECRDEWRRLGREKNLSDQQISDVLKEGMDHGWTQPAMAATMDQRQKTNRQQWIRTMNETKREPIMSQ